MIHSLQANTTTDVNTAAMLSNLRFIYHISAPHQQFAEGRGAVEKNKIQ